MSLTTKSGKSSASILTDHKRTNEITLDDEEDPAMIARYKKAPHKFEVV